MSKRHNRKRTRSRPRHREPGKSRLKHSQTVSLDTSSSPVSSFPLPHFPHANPAAALSQYTYLWQNQLRFEYERHMEAERLRVFGGYSDDESSLFEPMLKVVTDLFGDIDYEDP